MRRASSALRGANCCAPGPADVPRYKAEIHVTLKRTVNDPQGLTIKGGLHSLGYAGVDAVRAGKYIEVWLDAPTRRTPPRRSMRCATSSSPTR